VGKRGGRGRLSRLVGQNSRMEASKPPEFEVAMASAMAAPEAFGASYDVAPASDALELGEGLEGDPAVAFRRTLGMFATGVTVLTARVAEQVHGMTANAFMSVSLQPPLVLISIDRRAKMGALLHEGTRFGVSVLEARQTGLSDRFAGRTANDPPEATFELVHETPLVEGALAHLVARVVRSYWGGDHSLFLGQVEFARYGEGRPLLFHGGRYERLIEDPQVFSLLPRELLDPILALGEEREYADGEPIMQRGEEGCDLLLVLEGEARVERPGRSLTIGQGELIGEIEVLDPGGGRIADIHAVGAVRTIGVSRQQLLSALEADPRAAVALIEVLAARFRETA
jgi:flavin reductase (DIM6/NTAB) family NADH-FMN oxidoreductase RutF